MTALDWAIVAAYLALAAGIGLAMAKRGGSSLAEYFVSGRKLPWWLAGTSMVATTFAADTPLAVTELVVNHGVAGNWLWWNLAMSGMLTVFFYARLWRRAGVMTDVEFTEIRYAGRPAAFLRGFRALYLAVPINLIIMGWVNLAMADILAVLLDIPQLWALGLCFVLAGGYAILAGLWGVVLTDFLQFFLAVGGSVVLAVFAVDAVGGMSGLERGVTRVYGSTEDALGFFPAAGSEWMPAITLAVYLGVNWWASWYPGSEPGGGGYIAQRIFSSRTERDGQLATLWFNVAHYALRPWPWILVALASTLLYPEVVAANPREGYIRAMVDLLPAGLTGVMVAAFAAANPDRVAFHAWAQWMATRQLNEVRAAASGMRHGLYLDLAVGAHPGGAETWEEGASFATGVSLGAPPDAFSPAGQAWNLAPLDPRALAAQGFRPLAETLRAQFRFAKLLRIDHILGFDRAFWVPTDGELPGAYVAMPRAAMLAVTRIEAARAGATVIGEDLGNVPEGLRTDLDASGLLGCRVAMFEREADEPPRFRAAADYDAGALAAFGSHDLPTWAGWRAARDIDWWEAMGHLPEAQAGTARARRAAEVAAFDAATGDSSGSCDTMHAFLARTPARLVAVQAEDVFGLTEQANLPGTVHAHPNWRRRLPVPPESFGADPRVTRTARTMGDNRPSDGRET